MITHHQLTESQRDILSEMYSSISQTVDALPYSDEFESLYEEFMRRAGVTMSRHHFWRALSGARKRNALIRKERRG